MLLSHTHQHVFLEPAVGIKTIIAILKDPKWPCFKLCMFLFVFCVGFRTEILFKGTLRHQMTLSSLSLHFENWRFC